MVMIEAATLLEAAAVCEAAARHKAWYSQQDNKPPAMWSDSVARGRYRLALTLRSEAGDHAARSELASYGVSIDG